MRTCSYQAGDSTVELVQDCEWIATCRRAAPRRGDRDPFPRTMLHQVSDHGTASFDELDGALRRSRDALNVRPVFRQGKLTLVPTGRVLVSFKHRAAGKRRLVESLGHSVVVSGRSEFTVDPGPEADPFQGARHYGGLDEVRSAEPELIAMGRHLDECRCWSSSEGGSAAENTRRASYETEITRAQDAWNELARRGLTVGSPSIRVAVLDEGVDRTHPELAHAMDDGYDVFLGSPDATPNPWNAHGTACAGLISADHGDRRVRGFAGISRLVPVRIAQTPMPGGLWQTSAPWIADAIDWSWRHGADVINCSWFWPESWRIQAALERALTRGRDGRGCVVVAAAGNHAVGLIDFPARWSGVTAVSATNQFDQFKSPTASDGQTDWGSNYGHEVDLAAPGVGISTCDNTGTSGFSPDDYYGEFRGTSAATPLVAGTAALLLAINPSFDSSEVNELLRHSTDPVAETGNRPNEFVGTGRLNVLAAVEAALATR